MASKENWKLEMLALLCDRTLNDEAREQAFDLKKANMPPRLYKYGTFNGRTEALLGQGQVWLANPNSFNDPFDSASAISLARLANRIKKEPISQRDSRLLRLIKGDSIGLPTWLIPFVKEELKSYGRRASVAGSLGLTSVLRHKLGVTCFTETATSVPMWAHYAAKHSGFCCEWHLEDWPAATLRDSMFPVVYRDDPLDDAPLVTNPHFPDAPKVSALIKTQEWGYEKEWRYVQGV